MRLNRKEKTILRKPNFKHLEELITKDAVKAIPVQRKTRKGPGVVVVQARSLMLLIAASRRLMGLH